MSRQSIYNGYGAAAIITQASNEQLVAALSDGTSTLGKWAKKVHRPLKEATLARIRRSNRTDHRKPRQIRY